MRQVVECVFKDDGRIKSVYAKRARGLMARFVVTTRPSTLSELQAFDLEGYAFAPRESDDATLVFNRRCVRQQPILCRFVSWLRAAGSQRWRVLGSAGAAAAASKRKPAAGKGGAKKKAKKKR